MNRIVTRIVFVLASLAFALGASAQSANYKIHKYDSNDGGILMDITPNGKWGIITLGTSAGGGTATPKLYNVDTEEVISVEYQNRTFNIGAVSDDGNIVVGSFLGRPAALNRAKNEITIFPLRPLWQNGSLTAVTPDGKWAVGGYNGYNGQIAGDDELNHDYYYSPLYVNIETGDTIATPNLPKKDMAHLDQHAMTFTNITADGRYIIGQMSWYIMQPQSGFVFIYDTTAKSYEALGYIEHDNSDWEPKFPNMHHIEGTTLSPDGHWLAGLAYMSKTQDGNSFNQEYGVPFLYDMKTKDLTVYDEVESNNITVGAVDNAGTIFGNPDTGSPLRDFRVLYQGKYWITLAQICKQQYGFSFTEKTGYERTGTVSSVSGDGSRVVCFPDPLGESYCFDFGKSVEEVCDGIDLLDNYSITPASGSVFSQISTIEINFGRHVQVLGTGKNVHLYKEDGTKVADGLTAGNQGLSLKTGSKTTVNAVFRTRALEEGVKYYVSVDAGAISVGNDETRINKEIRVNYVGRKNGPVEFVKSLPENHAKIRQIDASAAYILLTFDCPVKVTENGSAYIERVADGSRMATLTINEGNTEETKNQLLLYPTAAVYLHDGLEYKVVLEAGSVSDYAGSAVSLNEKIELQYHGTYLREVTTDAVIFGDDFSDPATSFATWLRFEGDHHTPLASMQNWQFDADNMPWQFGLADDDTYSNMYAASHSLYAPSAQSDDWMMTPQLMIPDDGKATLEFDAQNYMANKNDVLKLYVFEEDFEIPVLNSAWMEDVREKSVLLDEVTLTSGESQEKTEGEWTHYKYDLSKWAGKNIYIAFVNQNNNQSAIFVDNVYVQREVFYSIVFRNVESVVNQSSIAISGALQVLTAETVNSICLTLKDASGAEVSKVEWPISGNVNGREIPFAFDKELLLKFGAANKYSVDIQIGDKKDTYNSEIVNLSFEPVKRVVLEEMTGIDCPNCPQGILTIEKCEKAFGDQFIPISIHTYDGDPYMGNMQGYSTFLGLNGAPSARINRVKGTYYPMGSVGSDYYDTNPASPVWYDIVAQQLSVPALADITLKAVQSEDGQTINYEAGLRYAISAENQDVSLLLVVLEDGLKNYQANNLGSLTNSIFGEWGLGGLNSGAYAYPVMHNDVARLLVGQTMSGTKGLFPAAIEAGKTYTAELSSTYPKAIEDVHNASVVAMLIDSQSGEVINAVKTKVTPNSTAIAELAQPSASSVADVYSLSGVLVRKSLPQSELKSLPAGIYLHGGKKIIVR